MPKKQIPSIAPLEHAGVDARTARHDVRPALCADQKFKPPSRAASASALTRPWYM